MIAFAGLGGFLLHNPLTGLAAGAAGTLANAGLHATGSWILGGTADALKAVAQTISTGTAPNLTSTWFSAAYWRVAGLGAMLTLPFLFAAVIQALLRSDLALLGRVAFGYLPLSLLAVAVAAPITMLLLAATDQMSAVVASVGTEGGAKFIDQAARVASAASAVEGSPFFVVIVGLFALLAAIGLMLELLVREAAIYVVVLMLPLAFAAMVWPARRIWVVRMIELLISLILSKFVIVAVLALAGAAFTHGTPGVSQLMVVMSLIVLSMFAPWTLMRVLPFTEVAASAAGAFRGELTGATAGRQQQLGKALGLPSPAEMVAARLTHRGQADTATESQASGFPDARVFGSDDSRGTPGARASAGGAPAVDPATGVAATGAAAGAPTGASTVAPGMGGDGGTAAPGAGRDAGTAAPGAGAVSGTGSARTSAASAEHGPGAVAPVGDDTASGIAASLGPILHPHGADWEQTRLDANLARPIDPPVGGAAPEGAAPPTVEPPPPDTAAPPLPEPERDRRPSEPPLPAPGNDDHGPGSR